ncbi:MAG TPA: hypothetical protein VFK80_06655 [Limnochordia bacterium]|nr:hypothetical protein [Limnochordia bacterium]
MNKDRIVLQLQRALLACRRLDMESAQEIVTELDRELSDHTEGTGRRRSDVAGTLLRAGIDRDARPLPAWQDRLRDVRRVLNEQAAPATAADQLRAFLRELE